MKTTAQEKKQIVEIALLEGYTNDHKEMEKRIKKAIQEDVKGDDVFADCQEDAVAMERREGNDIYYEDAEASQVDEFVLQIPIPNSELCDIYSVVIKTRLKQLQLN